MLIAIVDGESIQQIGHYKTMFPNVSFPSSGPDAQWMAQNNAKFVFKQHSEPRLALRKGNMIEAIELPRYPGPKVKQNRGLRKIKNLFLSESFFLISTSTKLLFGFLNIWLVSENLLFLSVFIQITKSGL